MTQEVTSERAPLPTAPGTVIWANAGGTHWSLFARDGDSETDARNWVSLDRSMTFVHDHDIIEWEPRYCPTPAESAPKSDHRGLVGSYPGALPTASGTVIWAEVDGLSHWMLMSRGEIGSPQSTNWASLDGEARFYQDSDIVSWESRYYPSPAESRPQLGLPTYHLDEDGDPVETRFDRSILY
jgi:hypothetical protein